jgi:hypothetical protein
MLIDSYRRFTTRFVAFVLCWTTLSQLVIAAPKAEGDINADRAWHLAQRYYMRYFGGCGGVGAVVPRGDFWEAPVHFGYAGTFEGYIRVHRHTGAVSHPRYPTLSAASVDSWFASLTKRRR